jgi:hypothetical protein
MSTLPSTLFLHASRARLDRRRWSKLGRQILIQKIDCLDILQSPKQMNGSDLQACQRDTELRPET